MGTTSSFEQSIERQQEYVKKRRNEPDMLFLKHGFFKDGHEKYSDRQIKRYLQQEYHHTRQPDSYVLDSDVREARKHKIS